MKKLLSIALLSVTVFAFGQQRANQELDPDELPAVVIKNAGKDFSVYLPDRNPDSRVRELQDKFIGYDLGKVDGEQEYLVMFDAEDARLVATYNEDGKLIKVVEKYENVKLPRSVIFSVYKSFPDWTIEKDKYFYTQADGDVLKKQYNIKLRKGDKTKNIVIKPNGDVIAGL